MGSVEWPGVDTTEPQQPDSRLASSLATLGTKRGAKRPEVYHSRRIYQDCVSANTDDLVERVVHIERTVEQIDKRLAELGTRMDERFDSL